MGLALRKLEYDAQDDFLMILPEIGKLLRWCFRSERPEVRQELVQEALCLAWSMYASAHAKGKRIGAHGLAWYSWLQAKGGRRFCGESKHSLQQWASIETVDEELLAVDGKGRWPVCDAAAFRIDWTTFVDQCTTREARAFALLAVGHKRSHVAKKLDVSPSWMTANLDRLYEQWLEFQGSSKQHRRSLMRIGLVGVVGIVLRDAHLPLLLLKDTTTGAVVSYQRFRYVPDSIPIKKWRFGGCLYMVVTLGPIVAAHCFPIATTSPAW